MTRNHNLNKILRTAAAIGLSALGLSTFATSAHAGLIINGSFETNTGSGQIGFNGVTAAGWSTVGYNLLIAPGTADTTGAFGADGQFYLWGPNNGSNNGLPATSPDGGYFVAADGNYGPPLDKGRTTAPITQTLTGLTAGATYTVGFYWAASQQYPFDGATIQNWQVSFGGSSQNTSAVNLPNHGFSGWMHQTFDFTADGTSDVLSFLAVGNVAVPPFLLLDGVTLDETTPKTPTPEPQSFALMLGGLALIGGFITLRSRKPLKG